MEFVSFFKLNGLDSYLVEMRNSMMVFGSATSAVFGSFSFLTLEIAASPAMLSSTAFLPSSVPHST